MIAETEVLVVRTIDAFPLLLRVGSKGRTHSGGYSKMSLICFLLFFASVVVGQKTRQLVTAVLWKMLSKGQSRDL